MKKLLFFFFAFQAFVAAQYYSERSAEESFERSDLYFNSYYLNTFGLENFKSIGVGMIDDPFLNSYLNPALLPNFKGRSTIFYLDFRGDRSTEEVVESYFPPYIMRSNPYFVPRHNRKWISITRAEPEPTFSFGALLNPLDEITDRFYLGATYQLIRREEKFYTTPYWIYYRGYEYDSFGNKAESAAVPVKDRYSAKDEMISDAHLFSVFAGYSITPELSVGLSFNGVDHNREGGFLNSGSDEYGNTDKSIWENRQEQNKIQDYSHTDFSAGIMYKFSGKFAAGIKAGMLNGTADQSYNSFNYYMYKQNLPSPNVNWYDNYSLSTTNQNWKHEGRYNYVGFNFIFTPSEGKKITGYFRVTDGKEDNSNSSAILDTSRYASHWIYTYNNVTNTGDYNGFSFAKDLRYGYGKRREINREAMISFTARLNPGSEVIVGLYINSRSADIKNTEPVKVHRYSEYHSRHTGSYNYRYDRIVELEEIKELVWKHSSDFYTLQVPVILNFDINDYFGLTVGVNRILRNWEITEETIAYFTSRRRNEDGTVAEEIDFAERYKPADEKISENETDLFVKFKAIVSPEFSINLMVDPELKNMVRVSQWWLGFEARF